MGAEARSKISQSDQRIDSVLQVEQVALTLKEQEVEERFRWISQEFEGQVLASTSFGLQSAVMLHLLSQYAPQIPIVFIDTGYLFPETYRYMQLLEEQIDINLHCYLPQESAARQEALYGKLWEQGEEGLNRYALLNKVEPMDRALRELGKTVWLSGLRRVQSVSRKDRPFAEQQKEVMKLYPILDWSDEQVKNYMERYDLPSHPLQEQGYVTMGDWHSTRPLSHHEESAESTRYGGSKYECGLHLDSGNADFQI